jgi:hypothetical protein
MAATWNVSELVLGAQQEDHALLIEAMMRQTLIG